jgi:hypothetical protein
MTNVLRAKKDSVSKVLEKHARLDEPGDRFKSEATDGLHSLVDFAQLRYAIVCEIQPSQCVEILAARMLVMRRPQRFPNRLPNAVLVADVWRIWNWIAGSIVQCKLRDLISARAILLIAKARMIGVELHNVIAAGGNFVCCDYRSRINVVGKQG